MTKVKFLDDHLGTHVGFEMSGHAEYAKRGKEDIVCEDLGTLTYPVEKVIDELGIEIDG